MMTAILKDDFIFYEDETDAENRAFGNEIGSWRDILCL